MVLGAGDVGRISRRRPTHFRRGRASWGGVSHDVGARLVVGVGLARDFAAAVQIYAYCLYCSGGPHGARSRDGAWRGILILSLKIICALVALQIHRGTWRSARAGNMEVRKPEKLNF